MRFAIVGSSVDILFCMVSRMYMIYHIQVAAGPTTTWLSQLSSHGIVVGSFHGSTSGTVYSRLFSMSTFGGITCMLSLAPLPFCSSYSLSLPTPPRPALHPTYSITCYIIRFHIPSFRYIVYIYSPRTLIFLSRLYMSLLVYHIALS
jgi:hypothetical protein